MTTLSNATKQQNLRNVQNARFENLKEITSRNVSNLKVRYSYYIQAKNMEKLVLGLKGNRGAGLVDKRVNEIKNKIYSGEWLDDMSTVRCFYSPEAKQLINADGNHTVEALRQLNCSVEIKIIYPKNAVQISKYNSHSSKWTQYEHFYSGISLGFNVPFKLNMVRNEKKTQYSDVNKILSPSLMYGIMVKDTKHFNAGAKSATVEDWELLETTKTVTGKVKKDIDLACRLATKVISLGLSRNTMKFLKSAFTLHFNDKEGFELTTKLINSFNINSFDALIHTKDVQITKQLLKLFKVL